MIYLMMTPRYNNMLRGALASPDRPPACVCCEPAYAVPVVAAATWLHTGTCMTWPCIPLPPPLLPHPSPPAAPPPAQEIISSFNFTSKVNLSAIKRIYSSLLWHFEQVRAHSTTEKKTEIIIYKEVCNINMGIHGIFKVQIETSVKTRMMKGFTHALHSSSSPSLLPGFCLLGCIFFLASVFPAGQHASPFTHSAGIPPWKPSSFRPH